MCKLRDRNHVCACHMAFRNPRPMLKHWPLPHPPRPFAKSYRRCFLKSCCEPSVMTSIYFPREDSLGFSGEEFQLEDCSFKKHFNFRCCNNKCPLHHNISPWMLALAYWPGQKKGEANEMLLYLLEHSTIWGWFYIPLPLIWLLISLAPGPVSLPPLKSCQSRFDYRC